MKPMLKRLDLILTGDVSGLRGDIDECELTNAERVIGVNVNDLVVVTK